MKCFNCLKPRTDSPDFNQVKSAPLASAAPSQTAVATERSGTGEDTGQRRKAKLAYFDQVLQSAAGMDALRQYMVSIRQQDMLDFLVEMREYRTESDASTRVKRARSIFNTYLEVCSEREVTLDRPVREAVVAGLERAPQDLFAAAEGAVAEEIRRDVFPRFLKTPHFERLAGLA